MSNPLGLQGRILILGDETKSARAIERMLVSAGYAASLLDSFALCSRQARAADVALVILEPAASRLATAGLQQSADDDSSASQRRDCWARAALQFCAALRLRQPEIDVPIMVISKSQRPQDKIACFESGVTDYLVKPYQRAELLSHAQAHLRAWQSERERAERFKQLHVLHAVSSVLTGSLDPDALVLDTLAVLVSNLPVDGGVVYLRNPDTQAMTVAAVDGLADTEAPGRLLDLYAATAPLMNGQPLVLDPLPKAVPEALAGDALAGVRALVCAPLRLDGKLNGAICLYSASETGALPSQTELLATICNQLSVALSNARLYVETKKGAAQLAFVYNLGNHLMTSLEMDELLGYAVFTVGKSLDCDVCGVVVKTASETEHLASATEHLASAVYWRAPADRSHSGNWFNQARVARYLEATDESVHPSVETPARDRFLCDARVAVEMSVPLMFDDLLLGLLICGRLTARPGSRDDQKLLGAVAQQLSLAIRNTELYTRTKDTSITLAVEVSKRTRETEEQKRFIEKIIDSLPVSLYVVNRDMRIVAWNRNRELGGSGISRDEVLGKNVFKVLARQPRRILENEFTSVFRSGDIVNMEQESLYEGQRKVWKISKIPMRVDNAEVTHIITVGEDITEQKKMNEAVIHAEKLASIGRLAAGVVHEINNPLATIAACAEALTARGDDLQGTPMHEDFSEYLQIIRDEAFRCKAITNSLLEFSHQRQAEKTAADINQVIEQTLQLVKHHPKLGRMQVIKEMDESLTPVHVNEGQMKQVFIALISNAFDAMEGDGLLTIRTEWSQTETQPTVCVQFSDTGCGIPAAQLVKIFDPFFTTKPLGRGTGLGLSVCYGIVSEHGGSIAVDSTEGVGTTFRVRLPIYQFADANQGGKVGLQRGA